MADNTTRSSGGGGRLDASGPREVVYCHMCSNEWYQDEHGLTCPACEGEITEIVTPESDPRPERDRPATPQGLRDLHRHNPWHHDLDDSDPEEADIEEHITHGPGGSMYFSQTIRSTRPPNIPHGTRPGGRRPDPGEGDPDQVMTQFQDMMTSLMGSNYQPGQTGRSGPTSLFNQGQFGGSTFQTTSGPNVVGGRFTFTTGPMRPRDANGPQPGGAPVEDLASMIGNLFGAMGEPGHHHHDHDHDAQNVNMPPGPFGNLLASLLNPANARQGDAVYSQQALDQIITQLMEQHPTSNAPGPASPDAISSLPKKKVDKEMLGPEGKAECSVCMDEVNLDDEVVNLPCSHWFHESCASMWLSEHNTCPICRKGLEDTSAPPPQSTPSPRSERRSSRISLSGRPRLNRDHTSARNEARLDAIRANGRLSPTEENQGSTTSTTGTPTSTRRYQIVGNGSTSSSFSRPRGGSEPTGDMPGSFPSSSRYRDRDDRRSQAGGRTTSGGDHSRSSRRSSRSENGSGNGAVAWLRDRFGGGRRSHD